MTQDEFVEILEYLSNKYNFFHLKKSRKSISNVEMYFICRSLCKIQPDVILESGVFQGRSTLILSEVARRYCPGSQIIAANNRHEKVVSLFVDDYKMLDMRRGNGQVVFRKLDEYKSKRLFALVDGPKMKSKRKTYIVYDKIFKHNNVDIIFQHDIHREPDRTNFVNYIVSRKIKNMRVRFIKEKFINKYKSINFDPIVWDYVNLGYLERKDI